MLSPCLTPVVKLIDVSILPKTSLTTVFSYIHLMADKDLGGQP